MPRSGRSTIDSPSSRRRRPRRPSPSTSVPGRLRGRDDLARRPSGRRRAVHDADRGRRGDRANRFAGFQRPARLGVRAHRPRDPEPQSRCRHRDPVAEQRHAVRVEPGPAAEQQRVPAARHRVGVPAQRHDRAAGDLRRCRQHRRHRLFGRRPAERRDAPRPADRAAPAASASSPRRLAALSRARSRGRRASCSVGAARGPRSRRPPRRGSTRSARAHRRPR